MSKLDEKVALITGGSRGIGAAIAKRLAADGASVAITYAKEASAASAVVKAIELCGGKAVAIQADAADVEAVKGAVEKTVASCGRLDVLVNNAGTAIPRTFEETTLDEMDRVIDINVRGTLVATQAALKHMKPGGRIIMIGSSVGERVLVPGLVAYSATKGAVKMFSQGLSREVASRGITVNNVQPGPIDTDLNPAAGEWAVPQKAAKALDRYGRVDEIAGRCPAHLAADDDPVAGDEDFLDVELHIWDRLGEAADHSDRVVTAPALARKIPPARLVVRRKDLFLQRLHVALDRLVEQRVPRGDDGAAMRLCQRLSRTSDRDRQDGDGNDQFSELFHRVS